MHKARENNDGTFSIGKTWLMDDLARIQTFDHLPASNPSEQQQKTWASNIGFVVTITKPYYWQAVTPKERDFFIGSLVKIYKKYTGGKVPELLGFDRRDRDALLASGPQSSQPPSSNAPSSTRTNDSVSQSRSPARQPPQPQPPYTNRLPSHDGPKEPRKQPSREQFLRAQASQEHIQRPRPPALSPKTSHSSFSRDGAPSKISDSTAISQPTPPPSLRPGQIPRVHVGDQSRDTAQTRQPKETLDSRPGEGNNLMKPSSDLDPHFTGQPADLDGVTGGVPPLKIPNKPSLPDLSYQPPLQKPRPPPVNNLGQLEIQHESTDNFVTPLSTPGPSGSEVMPPSRGSNKSFGGVRNEVVEQSDSTLNPSMPGRNVEQSSVSSLGSRPEPKSIEQATSSPSLPQVAPPAPLQTNITSAESQHTSPIDEEEEHRPGLGPMIKKKPGKDVASVFRKAATAYGAFKPRPGGAAERLMASTKEQSSSSEPDGITSVVPAPLSRGMVGDLLKTPDQATAVTSSEPEPKPEPKLERTPEPPKITIPPTIETPPKPPSPVGERKRQRREDNMAKYCNALGIEPSLLDDRGVYFDDILTDLGWDGKLDIEKRIEDFEAEIRREIGRVQAGSWLGHLELQEGKVDQLAKLLEKTVEEAEELDGLLTLYSHELNVRNTASLCVILAC